MKTFVAVLMGLAAGIFLYFMVSMLMTDPMHATPPGVGVLFIVLLGGSVASGFLLLRGRHPMRTVLRRGCLLGAGEWIAMAGVGYRVAERNAAALVITHGGRPGQVALSQQTVAQLATVQLLPVHDRMNVRWP